MGLLKWLDNWVVRKKEDKLSQKYKNPFKKCSKSVIAFKCPSCGHHKGFEKKGKVKCTRCGYRVIC